MPSMLLTSSSTKIGAPIGYATSINETNSRYRYLRTIDICHDHFGFYLGWGSAVWLPTMYTLQAQYLARNPVELSGFATVSIATLGLAGYALFRSVNEQKDRVRRTHGRCNIWGEKAKVLRCSFQTADGLIHETVILHSGKSFAAENQLKYSVGNQTLGWWGIVRHCNYVGDLLLSYAMCALCGTQHLLPWTYAIFMTCILVHRCYRDEKRCRVKYGDQWAQYCSIVKWRLIPGIW